MQSIKQLFTDFRESLDLENDKRALLLVILCVILAIGLIALALYIATNVTQFMTKAMQIDNLFVEGLIFCVTLVLLALFPNFHDKYQKPIFIIISICILLGIIKPF